MIWEKITSSKITRGVLESGQLKVLSWKVKTGAIRGLLYGNTRGNLLQCKFAGTKNASAVEEL